MPIFRKVDWAVDLPSVYQRVPFSDINDGLSGEAAAARGGVSLLTADDRPRCERDSLPRALLRHRRVTQPTAHPRGGIDS